LAELKETVATTPASIEFDIPTSIDVWGVEYLLRDVVTRLLDNALRYERQDSRRITVTAREDDAFGVLEVADDGVGIVPGDHERIFERFVQINRKEMEQQGVGLGLSIARSLARLHGGDVTVASQPGEGSTFRLTIPPASKK
jgi:signal transduction histidine kinase